MTGFATRLTRPVRRLGRAMLDVVLPPLCLRCRERVSEPQSVCTACWGQIRFLRPPGCVQCGYPFPHDLGPQVKCGPCLAKPPVFRWLRAAIAYDDASRDLILGFKHADRLEALPLFARWLAQAVRDRGSEVDLLVPVPLHWRRLAMRRYNQAGLLANGLGRLTGLPVHVPALARIQATPSQGEMVSARARLKNVARVFAVPDRQRPVVAGKSVAVVDDVLTTGATVSACAKALLRAGARDVSVITLARVVRPLNI